MIDFVAKAYGNFVLKTPEVKFFLSKSEKIMLWISIASFINYLYFK